MSKSTKRLSRQAARAITRGKIRKLQKAGLLSEKINVNRKPSKYVLSQLYKYRSVISGKQAAVRVENSKKAAELRSKVGSGGRGRIVIIPREKGERFRVTKTGEIHSTRKVYGQTVEKTIGDKFTAPREGEKIYYTLPRRKRGLGGIKRHTFASFDEMLFYLEKYEINFEDIEDYVEVERFKAGSATQKRVQREYTDAVGKLKRNRKRKNKKKRGRR
jgi:hypothetical protein